MDILSSLNNPVLISIAAIVFVFALILTPALSYYFEHGSLHLRGSPTTNKPKNVKDDTMTPSQTEKATAVTKGALRQRKVDAKGDKSNELGKEEKGKDLTSGKSADITPSNAIPSPEDEDETEDVSKVTKKTRIPRA